MSEERAELTKEEIGGKVVWKVPPEKYLHFQVISEEYSYSVIPDPKKWETPNGDG